MVKGDLSHSLLKFIFALNIIRSDTIIAQRVKIIRMLTKEYVIAYIVKVCLAAKGTTLIKGSYQNELVCICTFKHAKCHSINKASYE
jgi:hypothetical protein